MGIVKYVVWIMKPHFLIVTVGKHWCCSFSVKVNFSLDFSHEAWVAGLRDFPAFGSESQSDTLTNRIKDLYARALSWGCFDDSVFFPPSRRWVKGKKAPNEKDFRSPRQSRVHSNHLSRKRRQHKLASFEIQDTKKMIWEMENLWKSVFIFAHQFRNKCETRPDNCWKQFSIFALTKSKIKWSKHLLCPNRTELKIRIIVYIIWPLVGQFARVSLDQRKDTITDSRHSTFTEHIIILCARQTKTVFVIWTFVHMLGLSTWKMKWE